MIESLADTIKRECAACKHIAVVYMSPNEQAFCVQLTIEKKTSPGEKHFTRVEPVFNTKLSVWLDVQEVVTKIRRLHPEVDANVVSYIFNPGSWETVYKTY